ncbi:MAG: rhomboid family intramembrane serine protease [Gammaproteobacteria bacterium]
MNPQDDARRFRQAVHIAVGFTLVLWVIRTLESLLGLDLGSYGNYPGSGRALAGILAGPLIHGSWSHLISNTAPLIVLGTALIYGYPRSARLVIPAIYFGAGLGVWLFARPSYHIGASGLTFVMLFFVFTIGTLRWDRRAIALALVVFLLYGSMIWGVFPTDPKISYESHLAGALIGIALAIVCRHRDPAAPEKRYSWEDDEADDDEPPSGERDGAQ